MAIITISLTTKGPFLVSGIPGAVEIETNIPAVVFYTLDGSEPNISSSVYIDPIDIPTGEDSIRLRVLAVSGSDSGILDITFSPDITDLTYPRRSQNTSLGIAVDAYGVPIVLTDGYGVDAYDSIVTPVRSSDYALEDLEIKYSRTGTDGYGPGTMFVLGPYPEEFWQDDATSEDESSPTRDNVYFNSRSLYIVIDGRDGYDGESVFPINRPWGGAYSPVKYLQGKSFFQPDPFVSGGLTRYFVNYNTGTIVFYYFSQIENRWIKSIQSFDTSKVPQRIGDRRLTGPPIVFKWIYNRRSMI